MIAENSLPKFLTKTMKRWLMQYHSESYESITKIGLFDWEFIPNRRNPTKPRRVPKIGESITLQVSSVSRSVYLFEVDTKTLHVYERSGLILAGYHVAFEYKWNGKEFCKGTEKLFSMIS